MLWYCNIGYICHVILWFILVLLFEEVTLNLLLSWLFFRGGLFLVYWWGSLLVVLWSTIFCYFWQVYPVIHTAFCWNWDIDKRAPGCMAVLHVPILAYIIMICVCACVCFFFLKKENTGQYMQVPSLIKWFMWDYCQ